MAAPLLSPTWFLNARLKLSHLRLFVALDTHRNLVRAAASIGISQPAASKLLGDIEKILDVRLFERLPRGLAITEYGAIMVRHARTALSELTKAGDELAALQQGHDASVSIGAHGAPAIDFVVQAINRTRRDHPKLQISVEIGHGDFLTKRLLDGAVDFAICRIPPDVDGSVLIYDELAEGQLSVIGRRDHRLLSAGRVPLADLVSAEWVLQPPGTVVRKATEELFRGHGLPVPQRVINSTSYLMILAMLRETDAVSVVARSVADLFVSLGSIRILFDEPGFRLAPIGIVRARDRPITPAASVLLDAVFAAARPSIGRVPPARTRPARTG